MIKDSYLKRASEQAVLKELSQCIWYKYDICQKEGGGIIIALKIYAISIIAGDMIVDN